MLIAKLATGEMAYDDVWWGGKVKNPWNIAEGSSGSSAGDLCIYFDSFVTEDDSSSGCFLHNLGLSVHKCHEVGRQLQEIWECFIAFTPAQDSACHGGVDKALHLYLPCTILLVSPYCLA